MIGAEIGMFLNTIRKADLNITTAEWIELSSRTESPVARTKAFLASSDPVALDFHATNYLLFIQTQKFQFMILRIYGVRLSVFVKML